MNAERFGPYELHSLLGRGGMGEVHRAMDTRKNRGEVALKRLPAGMATDLGFQRRFLREAELAARLRNPHVIPIHDYGEIDDQPYLDMRLVDGIDLAAHVDHHGQLPPARAVEIVAQVASALDAAHREGLVHRDVKPQNILLDRSGHDDETEFVYLIDFGIAANLLTNRRSSSLVSGTAAYMAPERFTTGGDHRVDIYALGCVLYEVLAGQTPFTGDFVQLMYAHVNTKPPAPSTVVPNLPDRLDAVIATAMAKKPDQRYADAGSLSAAARGALTTTHIPRSVVPSGVTTQPKRTDAERSAKSLVRHDLQQWSPQLSDHTSGIQARPAGTAADDSPRKARSSARPKTGPLKRRVRTLTGAATILLAALLIAAVLVDPNERLGQPVNIQVRGTTFDVALSPDGNRAYASSLSTPSTISVVDTDRNALGATIPVRNSTHIAISRDGRRAYVADRNSRAVSAIDTTSNTVAATIPISGTPFGLTLSPDGRRVYVTSEDADTVSVIDLANNTAIATVRIWDPYLIAVSPDGRRVYVTRYQWGAVSVIDTGSNSVTGSISVANRPVNVAFSPDGQRAYVTSAETDSVSVIDTGRRAVVATIPISKPSCIAVSPDGGHVYVCNSSNMVSEIATSNNTVTSAVSVGGIASDLAIAPDGRRMYVANSNLTYLSAIEIG